MALAADPNEAKQEYAKKLYKLLYAAKNNENEDNVVKLFSMFASGSISKAELVMKLKAKQELRLAKKRGPIDWAILDRNGNPFTIVKAISSKEALSKGFEWANNNPVDGGPRGARVATPDDIKAVASRNEGQWSRWTVYDHDNNVLTYVSARSRQEATQLALRWGRENNRVVAAVDQDDGTVRIPSSESKKPTSLADYITESNRPFIWQKEEPKKELTEMQKACILGGHEYAGELK
jgi:hypothetical protein